MGENTDQPRQSRPPLGLPSGSVRALLTLLIVAVVLVQVARGRDVEPLWTETLMIALAHYFTSRRFLRLTPEVIRRQDDSCPRCVPTCPVSMNAIRSLVVGKRSFMRGWVVGSESCSGVAALTSCRTRS